MKFERERERESFLVKEKNKNTQLHFKTKIASLYTNIYKKRFLHSDFNFYLAEKTEELDIQELKVKLNKENLEEYEILTKEDSMKVTYQLTQSRKLKSGELHYIDHPKFGIIYRLVKAEKIEHS